MRSWTRSGRGRASSRSASSRCRPARRPTLRPSASGRPTWAPRSSSTPPRRCRSSRSPHLHLERRLPGLRRVQAPAVAARDGVLLRPAGPLGQPRGAQRQLARGRPAVQSVLRRSAVAVARRRPVRRLAGLAAVARRDRVAAAARVMARLRPVRPGARAGRPAGRGNRRCATGIVAGVRADVRRSGARDALKAAGIKASVRGTSIRFAPHVYNTEADIDRVVEVISPFLD